MGKVTSPNGSSPSSSTTERSKTGNGTTIQPAAVISRAGTSAFKSRSAAPKPQINLGASRVLQQLSEINRRMGSGNLDPNLKAPMESQRNALIEELEQNTSVLVTHRSDGTIRVRLSRAASCWIPVWEGRRVRIRSPYPPLERQVRTAGPRRMWREPCMPRLQRPLGKHWRIFQGAMRPCRCQSRHGWSYGSRSGLFSNKWKHWINWQRVWFKAQHP